MSFILQSSAFSLFADNAHSAQVEQLSAGVQRHQLDNGVVCLIKEDASAPLVSIQVWVGSGSAQEGEYLGGGLSHLIEHMIFKGTPRRKPADISKAIDDAGGSINAYTTLDRTVFWVDMPAEKWETGLDVLADAVLNASFPEDEWRREKEVVRREMAMGNDNPDNALSRLLWQRAYLVHPYRFPVIGKEEIFNTLSRADLLAFFHRHYTPDNMIVAVTGNIQADRVRAEVESLFNKTGRGARPLPKQTVEPPQLSPRSTRKTGDYDISRLEVAWHTVGLSHPDAPALDMLAVITGGGKSSRLTQNIKETRKLAFNIEAWSWTPKDAGLFGISATFDPAKEEELIKAIEEEVASWRTNGTDEDYKIDPDQRNLFVGAEPLFGEKGSPHGDAAPTRHNSGKKLPRSSGASPFTAAEVEKARNKILADTLMAFQTMHGQADTFASGEFYAGTPLYFDAYLKRLSEVTPESLTIAANKYLNDNNRTIAILSPAAGPMTASELCRASRPVTNESIAKLPEKTATIKRGPPMEGRASSRPNEENSRARLIATEPMEGRARASAKPPSETGSSRPNEERPQQYLAIQPAEINIVKKIFSNGLTLLCRQDNRLPFIDVCIVSQGGLLLENTTNNGMTCLVADLLTRGTKSRSQEEMAQTVESRGGNISSFSGINSYGLQSHCFSTDAELFMEVLADCFLNPVFSEKEIAKAKAIQIAKIAQQHESPMFLAQEALRKELFAGHPYGLNVEGSRESVMTLAREDLCNLHGSTAVGSNTVIAVFGDISPVKAAEFAEKYFGKMAGGQKQDWQKNTAGPEALALPKAVGVTGRARASRSAVLDTATLPAPTYGERCQTSKAEGLPRRPRIELTSPREQTVILAGFPGLAVSDERTDALDIILDALNGLSSDLMISVRDKKGLAYYTGAYHRAGIAGGQFVVYSGTRAESVEDVNTLIIREIKRLASNGLRIDEFERARRQITTEHRKRFQVNAGLAMDCALNELYGLGFAHALETEKRIKQLTPNDVRKTAADILRMEKMVTVTVKPEK